MIMENFNYLDYFEFMDKIFFIKEQLNNTLSIGYLYRSQIKNGYISASIKNGYISASVINVTINESKKETCKKCKFFSNCNYSDNIFVDFKTTFNDTESSATLLRKIIIRKLLLNKKYGCLKNIKKYSPLIEEIKSNIKISEEKIKTMKELQMQLSQKACGIFEDDQK